MSSRALIISEYEDLIYGTDGTRSVDKAIAEAYRQAKEAETRVRVEIRIQASGMASTAQAGRFIADPEMGSIDTAKRKIVDMLNDNPGPAYEGQVRINFKLNSTGEHVNSFTRTIKIGIQERQARFNVDDDHEMDDEGYEGNEEDGEVANSAQSLSYRSYGGGAHTGEPTGMEGLPPLMRQYLTMLMADANDRRQQLEVTMGFMHRKDAMMMTMFDRAIRAMENYSLRFGLPNNPPGISDVVREQPADQGGGGGGGLGLLPQLLAAAAQFAQGAGGAPSPPQAALPPPGAGATNRMDRIRSAGENMRHRRPNMPPPVHGYDQGEVPQPGDPNDDSPGMSDYRQESMRPLIEDHGGGDGHDGGFDEGYGDDEDLMGPGGYDGGDDGPDYDGGGGGASLAPPDLSNMDADQMLGVVEEWLEQDPSRKADVMQRLPQLTGLLS
jgi:hypothetical protein